jgi:hypothetical protein
MVSCGVVVLICFTAPGLSCRSSPLTFCVCLCVSFLPQARKRNEMNPHCMCAVLYFKRFTRNLAKGLHAMSRTHTNTGARIAQATTACNNDPANAASPASRFACSACTRKSHLRRRSGKIISHHKHPTHANDSRRRDGIRTKNDST